VASNKHTSQRQQPRESSQWGAVDPPTTSSLLDPTRYARGPRESSQWGAVDPPIDFETLHLLRALELAKKPSRQLQVMLADHLRYLNKFIVRKNPVLAFVADALDPGKRGHWRLEFKRRRGKRISDRDLRLLWRYECQREYYEKRGARKPSELALDDLAKDEKCSTDAVYAAVRRGRKAMKRQGAG
jgi:hypothetical protein